MVDKKKIIICVLFIIVVLVLILLRANSIKKTSIYGIDNNIGESNFTLIFYGNYNKDIRNELKELKKTYGFNVFVLEATEQDVKDYLSISNGEVEIKGNLYLVYDKKGLLGYIDDTKDKIEYIKKYLYNHIPTAERKYSTPSVQEFKDMYLSKQVTITVLGDSYCGFCSQLESVINELATNGTEINYINTTNLTEDELNQLYSLDIVIPGTCTNSGLEVNIKDGYAKPMTIVSKKGKVIGCIKGYYEYSTYLSKLNAILG